MKILVINSLYPPYHRGGAEVVVGTIVHALKTTHDVHVMTLRPWKGMRSLAMTTTKEEGVTVHRFFAWNIFSFLNIARHSFIVRAIWHIKDAFNIHSYFMTRRLIARLKPDLILSHNIKGIGYTVFRAIQASKVCTIHTMHDVQMIEPSGLIMWGKDQVLTKPSFLYRIIIFFTRWLAGSPQTVIFPSQFLKELYERYGFFKKSTCEIVLNPVPDAFFAEQTQEKILHTPCRFFNFGQVEVHKGIRPLLEALALVPELDCMLTIAGSGSLVAYVKECAVTDPRINYVGMLDRNGVKDALGRTDYTIMPSLCYENSPMAIYESMANGVPVIAARIGGVAELVDDGVNGYIFTPADVAGLANALRMAVHNADYGAFSRSAHEKVKESAVSGYVRRLQHFCSRV
ncbi:MAG: glycosyltransferase [bacterium]|nr:glycosyltransferase [bacterium]